MTGYETKTMEQLFKAYQFENDRINKKDADTTKANITKEVYKRVKKSFDLLDIASTEKDAIQIYKQFIQF